VVGRDDTRGERGAKNESAGVGARRKQRVRYGTYAAGDGACTEDITCRKAFACAGKVSELLRWRPVQLVDVACRDMICLAAFYRT
jgi:hypothetical protein